MATTNQRRHVGDITGVTVVDEVELKRLKPEQILSLLLSTRTLISTTPTNQLETHREIGKGQTGTVFSVAGTPCVLKVANEGRSDQLWNDCVRHRTVEESFKLTSISFRREINIPPICDWVPADSTRFWDRNLPLIPGGQMKRRTYALVTGRIDPVPESVREALVDVFAPREIRAWKRAFLAEEANKDCLIRIYMGRRRTTKRTTSTSTFKLRNFDMTIDEMELLSLDTTLFARTMAETLAIIHWKAGLDANDVEFVIGTGPIIKPAGSVDDFAAATKDTAPCRVAYDPHDRPLGIWLLDFDQCKPFEMKDPEKGIKQLRDGFFFNDPYYPRPSTLGNDKDNKLWQMFRARYLDVGKALTDNDGPRQFIGAGLPARGRRIYVPVIQVVHSTGCHWWAP